MKSIFDPTDNAEIRARIQGLRPDTAPQWGKMNVAQMLAHCQPPLHVANGDLKLKWGLMGMLFGKMAKKKLLSDQPWGKNMPTAPEFKVVDSRDFETEKSKLLALVEQFRQKGPSILTQNPHPFFGKLTQQEWDQLQIRHLDYHLTQFGV